MKRTYEQICQEMYLTYDIREVARLQEELLSYYKEDGETGYVMSREEDEDYEEEIWTSVPGSGKLYELSSRGRLKNNYTGDIQNAPAENGVKTYWIRFRGKLKMIEWER